ASPCAVSSYANRSREPCGSSRRVSRPADESRASAGYTWASDVGQKKRVDMSVARLIAYPERAPRRIMPSIRKTGGVSFICLDQVVGTGPASPLASRGYICSDTYTMSYRTPTASATIASRARLPVRVRALMIGGSLVRLAYGLGALLAPAEM